MQMTTMLFSILILSVSILGCNADKKSDLKGENDTAKAGGETGKSKADQASSPDRMVPSDDGERSSQNAAIPKDDTRKAQPSDITLVMPDAVAALVFHPRRVFTAPDVAGPWKRFLARVRLVSIPMAAELNWLRSAGFSLEDLDQVTLVIQGIRTLPEPPADDSDEESMRAAQASYRELQTSGFLKEAYVLRFHEPAPQSAIAGVLFRPVEAEYADKSYFGAGKDVSTAACYFVDQHTIVVGEESVVRKMLVPNQGDNALSEQLKSAGSEQAIVAAFDFNAAGEQLAGFFAQEPTSAAMVKSLKSATLAVDLEKRPKLSLTVVGKDAESAAQVGSALRDLLNQGKEQLPPKETLAEAALPKEAKVVIELGHKAAERVNVEYVDDRVTVSLADVVDRGELFELLDLVVSSPEAGSEPVSHKAPEDENETAAIIRQLATSAAGMANADLQAIATSATAPKPTTLEDQPLTLAIFCEQALPLDKEVYADRFAELEFPEQGSTPNPSELVRLLTRSSWLGYCSMLQPDYITKVTCNVAGDRASGVITFDAGMYAGCVHYKANKLESVWQIDEFSFPVRDWRFARAEDGTWQWFDLLGRLEEDRELPNQEVTGSVELDGKPVELRDVVFHLKDNPDLRFYAKTAEDGTFSAQLVPGEYLVIVRSSNQDLSEKYGRLATTPLRTRIVEGANELTLKLQP